MKKIILLTAVLVMSTNAFARTDLNSSTRSVKTDSFNSEQQALEAGYELMENYQTLSSFDLSKQLQLWNSDIVRDSVTLEKSEVTVEKFSTERGSIQYRAKIDMSYQYKQRDI